MASIFSKNGILLNRLDHYCLICDVEFLTEDAALAHMLDVIHKEALKKCGYLEKYKNHFIRKTNGLYFCEPCNLTYPTATKVELHIDEESHIDKRNKMNPFQRVKDEVIAFNRFVISYEAWNGCIKDTCFLCNTEFEDAAAHWVIKTHMLKLIKSEVIFDSSNHTVYRTIDERSKQCLTCNVIIENDLATHYATAEHKEAYKLHDDSCENLTVIQNGNENTDKKKGVAVVSENVNSDINKKADKSANKKVKKDFKKDAKHDSDKESSKLHEKVKVTQTPKKSVKKENADELDKMYCKNLGAKNYITGEYGERWCVLCGWLLEEFNIGDHIQSKHHQYLLKLHNERIMENINNTSSEKAESMPYECVERYQKSNVNIDLINETAFCKQCSKNVDFNTSTIDKHIEEHKKTSIKKSPQTLSSGIKSNGTDGTTLYTKPVLLGKQKRSQKTESVGDFAKKHGLSHNVADRSYYCRLCCRRLNNNLDDLQKHVASKTHMENTKQPAKTDVNEAPVKEPISKYVKCFEIITKMKDIIIIINKKFWLNAFGFFLIARNDHSIFCHGCNIDLTLENVMQHIIVTDYHRGMIDKCLLITSLENEFIREIKLDVYHCGYCNSTENDWDDILDHIELAEHKREKEKAEISLRQHQPNAYQGTKLREIDDMLKQFVRLNH